MARAATKKSTKSSGSGLGAETLSGEEFIKRFREVLPSIKNNQSISLAKHLESVGMSFVLIVHSTHHVRVRRLVKWLRDNLFCEQDAFSFYFGTELVSANSASNIVSDINTPGLFSRDQLIAIYEANKIKAQAEKLIIEALHNASGRALLLLSTDSLSNKTGLIAEVSSLATLIELNELKGPAIERWLDKEIDRINLAAGIDPEAKAILLHTYGSDVTRLSQEIEKLSLLCAGKKRITKNLVEELCIHTPEASTVEILKCLIARNFLAAQTIAYEVVEQGQHPLQVLAFLSKILRSALPAKEKAQAPHKEIANSWFLKQLGPSANQLKLSNIKHWISVLAELDFQLKDSKLPGHLALSMALRKMSL